MIRPLRLRHRAAWIVLALAVPALVGWGLATRRPVPASAGLPAVLAGDGIDAADVVFSQRRRVPGGIGISVRHLRPVTAGGPPRLALQLTDDPRRPELLAYWSAGSEEALSRLPEDARLLGPLELDRDLIAELPESARHEPGRLVVYSLAQAEVVEVFALATGTERP